MKTLAMILAIIFLFVPMAMAVEAHFDFGGEGGNDGAAGYVVQWGTSAGVYDKQAEINKTACIASTDSQGPYDCSVALANSDFVVDTRYYFTVYAWQWAEDGINKYTSSNNPTAEFILRSGGGTPGVAPKAPMGLGIYPVAH